MTYQSSVITQEKRTVHQLLYERMRYNNNCTLSDIMRNRMHRATSNFDNIIVQYMYYQYEKFQSKSIISKYFSDVFCTGTALVTSTNKRRSGSVFVSN